jgi:uncharacterized protein
MYWLDIYFFRDAEAKPLAAALQSERWAAARCVQTDAELALVLQRPRFSSNPAERERLLECLRTWQARVTLVSLGAQAPLHCRDSHDQKFLDLAYAAPASALLTKDKGLLAVHRAAQRVGLMILTPRQFADRLLALDERLESAEGLVPLLRNPLQVAARLGQTPRLKSP